MKCAAGPVVGWEDKVVPASQAYFEFWKCKANEPDEKGRDFPGKWHRGMALSWPGMKRGVG